MVGEFGEETIMSKATNREKQHKAAAKKRKASARPRAHVNMPKGKKRKNPPIFNISGDPLVMLGLGLLLIAAPMLGIDFNKPLLRRCTHKEPVPCPRDEKGTFLNAECFHFGHVPDTCHECYCKGQSCAGCVGQFGEPCPPDCANRGNHFDGCHRRDCLGLCGKSAGERVN